VKGRSATRVASLARPITGAGDDLRSDLDGRVASPRTLPLVCQVGRFPSAILSAGRGRQRFRALPRALHARRARQGTCVVRTQMRRVCWAIDRGRIVQPSGTPPRRDSPQERTAPPRRQTQSRSLQASPRESHCAPGASQWMRVEGTPRRPLVPVRGSREADPTGLGARRGGVGRRPSMPPWFRAQRSAGPARTARRHVGQPVPFNRRS